MCIHNKWDKTSAWARKASTVRPSGFIDRINEYHNDSSIFTSSDSSLFLIIDCNLPPVRSQSINTITGGPESTGFLLPYVSYK